MKATVEIERSHWSIVLLGNFNPAIFHPSWFDRHDVISTDMAAMAELHFSHREMSEMEFGDIKIVTEVSRFQIETTNAPEIRLLDFVSKVFGDILPHTKVRSFGINKSVHFRASSPEKRLAIGRALAPLEPWGSFGERIEASAGETLGGMTSLHMREMLDDDETKGHFEVRVEPSRALDSLTGIYMSANRHCEMKDFRESEGARRAIAKLDREFALAQELSDEVINHFLEFGS